MSNSEQIRQPVHVSRLVANYLDMTAPRARGPRQRPRRRRGRPEPGGPRRPVLDNRGLGREEGNDFA